MLNPTSYSAAPPDAFWGFPVSKLGYNPRTKASAERKEVAVQAVAER